jgi:predicted ArsR family transcriptional regulator
MDTPRIPDPADSVVDRLGLLLEPARRRVYSYVATSGGATRDETAAGVAIARPLATFHLERLLEAGLLTAESRAGTDETGRRRRGRPSKVYRPRDEDLAVSFPQRDYRLAAELFADALATLPRPTTLDEVARERGRAMGKRARSTGAGSKRQGRLSPAVRNLLVDEGYAPLPTEGGRVCLANCPFDAVAKQNRDVICPTNLALLEGVIEGSGTRGVNACLDAAPGRCCVVLEEASARSA